MIVHSRTSDPKISDFCMHCFKIFASWSFLSIFHCFWKRLFFATRFSLKILSFWFLSGKKFHWYILLCHLVCHTEISLSLSVMIWNLRLDELLAEIEDGDLLEEKELDELDEVWCRRCFLLLWYLSFKLLLWGDLDLIDDDELFLVYLHFSIFFYN